MSDKIDKVFELLEKVYIELQDTKKDLGGRIDNLDIRVVSLEKEVKENTNRLTKLEAVIETDIKPDIKAVYQLQTNVAAKLDNHDSRLENIEKSVETLTSKSLRHSYEIGAIKREKKAK